MGREEKAEDLKRKIQDLERQISRLQKVEQELTDNQEFLQQMFVHMPCGIAIYTPLTDFSDFIFRAFNKEAANITRVSQENVIGKSLLSLFPNMGRSALFLALQRVAKNGIEEYIEPFYYQDEIREGWRENRIYRLPSGDVVAIFTDVTELKKAEQEIAQKRSFLQQLMETSPVGITVVDRNGHITLANRLAEEILGLQSSDICSRQYNDPSWRITDLQGNPFQESELPFNQVKAKSAPVFGMEHAIEWADGKKILLSINAAPLFNDKKEFDGVVAIIEDITQRRHREDENKNLIDALRKALSEVKNLSGLLPICSHCKKIRDDQGYWNQLEEYVSKHSDALFSHSICPDCMKTFYTEWNDEK